MIATRSPSLISLHGPISFNPYEDNQVTGGFVLVDRLSNATVAAGLIRFGLRRAANIYCQPFEITKAARKQLMGHKPALLWFTGLSGAGKSTIADHLEKKLHALGKHTFVLEGANVHHGLNRDLGFTEADRVENIRRVAEVGKLFVEAGLITMVAFISPFRAERETALELMGPGEFFEIFVNTPLETCERRDTPSFSTSVSVAKSAPIRQPQPNHSHRTLERRPRDGDNKAPRSAFMNVVADPLWWMAFAAFASGLR